MLALILAVALRMLDPAPLSWDERRRIGVAVVCEDGACALEIGACWRCPACCAVDVR